jgi:hypothetical protein
MLPNLDIKHGDIVSFAIQFDTKKQEIWLSYEGQFFLINKEEYNFLHKFLELMLNKYEFK